MAYNYELGDNVQIFFGKVHDQHDTETKGNFTGLGICRCQIIIPGITDEVDPDLLPWYFPWYGRNYLPEKGDTVPVMIFDENFATGFYGRKLDLEDRNLDPNDYNNYLEIFKRNCDGDDVQLTYKTSKGIEIFNGTEDGTKGSKLHLELELFTAWCESNSIQMDKDRIKVGKGEAEFSFNSETTRNLIELMIDNINKLHEDAYKLFDAIAKACTNPYTIPIKAAIMGLNPKYKMDNTQTHQKHKSDVVKEKTISKMLLVAKDGGGYNKDGFRGDSDV